MMMQTVDAVICTGVVCACMVILRQIAHAWTLFGWLSKIPMTALGMVYVSRMLASWSGRPIEILFWVILDAAVLVLLVAGIIHHWNKFQRL